MWYLEFKCVASLLLKYISKSDSQSASNDMKSKAMKNSLNKCVRQRQIEIVKLAIDFRFFLLLPSPEVHGLSLSSCISS